MAAVETWRPVVGFEGAYEVSDLGRVRSLDRPDARGYFRKGQTIQPGPHPGGYQLMHLYLGGRRTARLLHIVVAEAFIGPKPFAGAEVRHLDNDRMNCAVDNLAWGTRAENEADKLTHGTIPRGEANVAAKLTAADVKAIRARRGEPQQALADEFGCTFSNISAIQLNKSWRHV